MEGLMVHYDGTVRNSNKQLLQLRYGEDGMDGAKMEFQVIPSIKPPNAKFEQHFKFDCHNSKLVWEERGKREMKERGRREGGEGREGEGRRGRREEREGLV
jgi:hypothetical protein